VTERDPFELDAGEDRSLKPFDRQLTIEKLGSLRDGLLTKPVLEPAGLRNRDTRAEEHDDDEHNNRDITGKPPERPEGGPAHA
jgi:hypothetical protein